MPAAPIAPSEFEEQIERLGLTYQTRADQRDSESDVSTTRNRCYVPEGS
jgi:hypothetical protein